MPNSLDLDVEVDWLYKGKKKVRANRRLDSSSAPPATPSAPAPASTSVPTPAPGSAGVAEATPGAGTDGAGPENSASSEPAQTPTPAAKTRNRSSSHSQASLSQTAANSPNTSGRSLKPSSAVLRRSSSLGEKPKKSLFGSLFNRKPLQPLESHTNVSSTSSSVPAPVTSSSSASGHSASTASSSSSPTQASTTAAPASSSSSSSSSSGIPIPINISQFASHRQQISQFLKEPNSPEVKDMAPIQHDRVVLNKNPNKSKHPLPIKELTEINLKRVTFAVDEFGMDPPQQIPSRKPKLGNVLVPNDMISDIPSISQGITTTAQPSSHGNDQHGALPASAYTKDSKEYQLALENHKKCLKESEKHQQEAHYAAQRIASEVAGFKLKPSTSTDLKPSANGTVPKSGAATDDEANAEAGVVADEKIKSLEIDKPIHMHEHHFKESSGSSNGTGSEHGANPSSTSGTQDENGNELMLDVVYTRCCHLREILPIPSTLRQLKEKKAPLQTLKFLNPRPTLIDILSFSDFIAIVPIHNVVFDNVGLSPEMFKIVISSLVKSITLERLSMRNVVFDERGWKLLCKFLMRNKSLTKLDISQTKIRHDLDLKLHRSQMDWSLFIDVLHKRQGKPLEELLLNGVSFANNLHTFENMINAFSSTKNEFSRKRKLGLAQSQIASSEQLEILFRWMSENDIIGVDLAFNDFENLTKPIIKELSQRSFDSLQYFTLNSTNIQSVQEAALIIRELSKLPKLYFLDLSGLPSLFPAIFPYLNKYLPRFPSLKRLHFDSNEWTYKDISLVTQILPKCKELLHVSMMNQPQESWAMSAAVFLYDCIKNSDKLINLDFNYENIPEEINSRIAIALVRNAQKSIDSNWQLDELSSQDDLLFDGELISETAGNILDKLNDSAKLQEDSTKRYLLKRYWEKIHTIHANVQKTIDSMFEQRISKELSLQSKENLLRLIFMENTLGNILEYLSTNPYIQELNYAKNKDDDNYSSSDERPVLKHVDSERIMYAKPLVDPIDQDIDQELEHEQDSNSAKPHLMATDSGRTIDVTTGRPILTKTSSQRSIFGKKQEEEEGELHKWGFFVQQQRSIYPENTPMSKYQQQQQHKHAQRKEPQLSQIVEKPREQVQTSQKTGQPAATPTASTPPTSSNSIPALSKSAASAKLIGKIPSGTELREAIIKAKGINSIEDLIDNVNCQQVKLDNIYGIQVEPPADAKPLVLSPGGRPDGNVSHDERHSAQENGFPSESEDSYVEDETTTEQLNVDETYDKLLNNLSRVRSNRG